MSRTTIWTNLLQSVAENSAPEWKGKLVFLPGILSLNAQLGLIEAIKAVTALTEKQQSCLSMALHLN